MKKILIKAFIIINVIFLYGCDEGSKSSSSDYQKRLDRERANTLNDIRKVHKTENLDSVFRITWTL